MTDQDPVVTDKEGLDSREVERVRRRDREADAEQRDLLRPGMGKVFKQIQDAQRKAAEDAARTTRPSPRARSRRPAG